MVDALVVVESFMADGELIPAGTTVPKGHRLTKGRAALFSQASEMDVDKFAAKKTTRKSSRKGKRPRNARAPLGLNAIQPKPVAIGGLLP